MLAPASKFARRTERWAVSFQIPLNKYSKPDTRQKAARLLLGHLRNHPKTPPPFQSEPILRVFGTVRTPRPSDPQPQVSQEESGSGQVGKHLTTPPGFCGGKKYIFGFHPNSQTPKLPNSQTGYRLRNLIWMWFCSWVGTLSGFQREAKGKPHITCVLVFSFILRHPHILNFGTLPEPLNAK